MRTLYTYEFATRVDGHWRTTIHAEQEFSRDPQAVARGLLEQWIIGRSQRLPGGGRVVVHGRRTPRRAVDGAVRVRVYSGRLGGCLPAAGPVATAYLTRANDHRAAA
jgi:hypothetical protein